MRFVLCPSCQRHIKLGESGCPFCGARASASDVVGRPDFQGARDRSAILFGAAVASAIAVAACNNTSSGNDNGLVMPYGVPVPQYPDAGQPVTDAGAATSTPLIAADASVLMEPPHHPIVQPYGVPVPHPTTTASSGPPKFDPPSAVPAYGVAPPYPPPGSGGH